MDKLLFLGIIIVAIGIYLLKKYGIIGKADFLLDIEVARTDILDLPYVLDWFKREDIIKLIKENQSTIPVLLKENEIKKYLSKINMSDIGNDDFICLQAVYDQDKDKLLKGRAIVFKKMDPDLVELFKDKSMIVFQ